jgi:hypothetical protein
MISSRSSRLILIATAAAVALSSLVAALPAAAHEAQPTMASVLGTFSVNHTPQQNGIGGMATTYAAPTDVTPAATKITYQWYRDGKKISGATKTTYKLTSSDYGTTTTLKVSFAKSGYTTLTLVGDRGTASGQYWIDADSVQPQLAGEATVNTTLTIVPRTFINKWDGSTINSGDLVKSYQWYRNGSAISGSVGKADHYDLKATDKGKTFKVKMTVSAYDFLLPMITTSASTQPIGTASLPGWDTAAATVDVVGSSTAFSTTVTTSATGITSPNATANKVTYQWLRNGLAIKNATKSTYKLTTTDRGHAIGVKIVTSHAASGSTSYTPVVTYADEHDFSMAQSGTPVIATHDGPGYAVGSTIEVGSPASVDADNNALSVPFERTYQWYRNGKAIKSSDGGTQQYYLLKSVDVGATIKVNVTVGKAGYIPYVYSATAASPVAKGTLVGTTSTIPTVAITDAAKSTLTATAAGPITGTTTAGSAPATITWQWLRNGVNIPGATKQTYTLQSADWNTNVKVRLTAKLAGYTDVNLESTPINYSILTNPTTPPRITGNSWGVGTGIQVVDNNFVNSNGVNLTPGAVTYEWLRTIGGKTTVAATGSDSYYVLTAADYGALMTARLTVTKPGYVPLVFTTPNIGYTVQLGETTAGDAVVQDGPELGQLTATVSDLEPLYPTPSFSYKWYRNGVAISGATAKTYTLVSADYDKLISVQITMKRTNFTQVTTVLPSTEAKHSFYMDPLPPELSGIPVVGSQLTATPPPYYENFDKTIQTVDAVYVYSWYRSGTLISGQSSATYTLQSADKGKLISVKVTAKRAGRVALTSPTSDAIGPVTAGTFEGTFVPSIVGDAATKKKTVTVTGETVSSPTGYSKSYVWKRSGVTVSGATSNSLTLKSTDNTKDVTVTITLTKTGYSTKVITAHVNAITSAEDVAITGGDIFTDTLTAVAPIYYYWTDLGADQVDPSNISYQWQLDGVNVSGDAGHPEQYTPQLTDFGKTVTVVVTATAPYHLTRVDDSAPDVVVE